MNALHANDRPMLMVMTLLWLGSIAYGAAISGVALPLMVGALLMAAAVGVALGSRAGTASQVLLPLLGMALVALMIHVARGRPEAHFAVFGFLAVTVVYRHWLPVLSGAATIAVHHLSFNFFQQWGWGPICFTEPGLMRVIEHAAFVVAEAAILIVVAQRARADFATGEELERLARALVAREGVIDFGVARPDARVAGAQGMVLALRRIEQAISSVQQSAQSIAGAAGEVAAGGQDLSGRTEQAAARLQQTASSMEQINQSVAQTAQAAKTADTLTSSAKQASQRTSQVVSQVVTTMGEINESSRRIADIIGVIDGIAFQTNILALNAAVEAARAGEQGRGFAVVASEVRSLAQRSAEAAREIKSLISTSVERVEAGSTLVEQAGATVGEVVQEIERVTQFVAEIASAAAGQSRAIGEVDQTVQQLDQMTQQNAALVEQSTAASASLREQAAQLQAAVAVFRSAPA